MTLFDRTGPGLDALYVMLRDASDEHLTSRRALIDAMFHTAAPPLDADFPNAFSRHCAQRYWELRLCAALLQLGYVLDPSGEGRPDFGAVLPDGRRMWVEAVAPTLGDLSNADRPPPPRTNGRLGKAPVQAIAMRYTQAMQEKRRGFERYRATGLVGSGDCCIVAINSAGLWPHVEGVGLPRIIRTLFGLGDEIFTFGLRDGETTEIAYTPRIEVVRSNGSAISNALFLSPEFAGIGGVVHHTGRPDGFEHDDTARFLSISNPNASSPAPSGFFSLGHEYVARTHDGRWTFTEEIRQVGQADF